MWLMISGMLTVDGLTTGVIYALLGVAVVLVFSVTRVLLIPQGEFVSYGALTFAAWQSQHFPATAWMMLVLGVVCYLVETVRMLRSPVRPPARTWLKVAARDVAMPVLIFLVARHYAGAEIGVPLQVLLTLAILVPLGPMVYRLAFEPVAEANTLTLLIISVALHFAMMGMGLVMFGPEGVRTNPFVDTALTLGPITVTGQTIVVFVTALVVVAALYLYFGHTLSGKALHATAVNRLGARLVGINTARAGRMTFVMAALLGVVSGILISPITTVYYDSGFLMSLKGFVGSVLGGLTSFPLTALGALAIGLLESWASFFASAYKEVIVFTLIIPILLWRSLAGASHDEEDEA